MLVLFDAMLPGTIVTSFILHTFRGTTRCTTTATTANTTSPESSTIPTRITLLVNSARRTGSSHLYTNCAITALTAPATEKTTVTKHRATTGFSM